jgi:hypothetical protein
MVEALVLMLVGVSAVLLTLKASGQWQGDRYLCDDCRFNDPESCLKPERPRAMSCTAYRPRDR